DRRLGYLLVAPAVVSLLAVTGYPLLYNLWNSFHHENLTDAAQAHTFSGVSNYSKLFSSSDFVSSLTRTVGFMVVSVAFETVVAGDPGRRRLEERSVHGHHPAGRAPADPG